MSPRQRLHHQAGFTLIELLVVVVIMAVVVSVGVLSVGGVNQDRLQSEKNKVQNMLKQMLDEAAFKQKLILLTPNDEGIRFYSQKNYEWQAEPNMPTVKWNDDFQVDWQIENRAISRQNLPTIEGQVQQGWLFWPSGEVIAGEIKLSLLEQEGSAQAVIRWDESLQFIEPEE